MNSKTRLIIVLVTIAFAFGCSRSTVTERKKGATRQFSLAEMQGIMAARFAELHTTYLAQDGHAYNDLLRATLRHARRLDPGQCVAFQRQLVELGNAVGYDGLESVWLVYQDCAASSENSAVASIRLQNATWLAKGLHFRREPLPQLPLRVTYWDSAIERGVRGEAVRAALMQFAHADSSKSQSWSLGALLRQPTTKQALCALPLRKDQFGKTALPEILRQAQCDLGTDTNPKDTCETLASQRAGTTSGPTELTGMSEDDKSRLRSFCQDMAKTSDPGSSGMDGLDSFSTDQCESESGTKLYETEKIAGLIMDCYFSGQGNKLAEGGTSADILAPKFLNKVLEYKIGDHQYGAALVTGKSADDPGRNFYGAYGSTPQEARDNLLKSILENPPPGYTAEKLPDGSIDVKGETDVKNSDGTTSHATDETVVSPDGSATNYHGTANQDGSGNWSRSNTNSDGSKSSISLEMDKDGNVTKKTETTTDKDGKTTTTTTEYGHDKDGDVTNTKTSTSTATESATEEGQFDPHNAACQQLMNLDIMPGSNRGKFWNELLNRPYRVDPRTVNPRPDDAGAEWNQEPFCGAPGVGGNDAPSKCLVPVLCADSYLDDSCQCKHHAGGQIGLRGCAAALCPEGKAPIPVGANACVCGTPETGDSASLPPRPLPTERIAFAELVWNRPERNLFITRQLFDLLRARGDKSR